MTHAAAVFCRTFLPFSETFVYDEVVNHSRWSVSVFCRVRENADRFPVPELHVPRPGLDGLLYRSLGYSPSFDRALSTGGHRLLHAHFGTNAVLALPFHLRRGLPLVITFHGFDVAALTAPLRPAPWLLRYRALAPTLLKRAALLLCPSMEVQDIIAHVSKRPDATRLYRLGIDLTRFAPAASTNARPRVVMIGRFVEKKGHLDGIAAFARLVAGGTEAQLIIIGAGPLEATYRAQVAAAKLGERVQFTGVQPATAVARILADSDVLLAPSKVASDGDRDSGLIVAKEASATALPVIGTRHGGIPEIIDDGVTGFLVDEGDVEALADRLQMLCSDAELRGRMGRAGREKMEREYDVRVRVAELERLYDEVSG